MYVHVARGVLTGRVVRIRQLNACREMRHGPETLSMSVTEGNIDHGQEFSKVKRLTQKGLKEAF